MPCNTSLIEQLDPIEERKTSRTSAVASRPEMTFRSCAEGLIAAKAHGWRNDKHRQQWQNTLATYAYPVIGDMAVRDITVEHVVEVLQPIWTTKTETATRLRSRIEAVLSRATTLKTREGDNPARWRGNLDTLLAKPSVVRKVTHHAALPYPQVGQFIGKLREREGTAARALEFLILTAARTAEVADMRRSEVDLDERVWTIPPHRMKAGKEHRVPLSSRAVAILRPHMEGLTGDQLVFPSQTGRSLTDSAFRLVRQRMGYDCTTHGFRATFKTWVGECTNFPRELAEAALAHAIGNEVEQAYMRGTLFDKRSRLMDAWATFCGQQHGTSGRVVALRKGI